jgi:GAF domain-containing protein
MGGVRREYWIDDASNSVWAVALSERDDSVVACAGPFAPKVAAVVDIHQLVYVGGPTLEWLRSRRDHFRACRRDGVETAHPPAPRAQDDATFDALLTEARRLTRAEAGTVYVREAGSLRFAASHNEVLERRLGADDAHQRLAKAPLSLDDRSIASFVLLTHLPVNLPDAYDIPADMPYVFNCAWDARNDYVTRSMLTLPVRAARGTVIGVLQLINARGARGAVVAFTDEQVRLVSVLLVQWAQRFTMRGG